MSSIKFYGVDPLKRRCEEIGTESSYPLTFAVDEEGKIISGCYGDPRGMLRIPDSFLEAVKMGERFDPENINYTDMLKLRRMCERLMYEGVRKAI